MEGRREAGDAMMVTQCLMRRFLISYDFLAYEKIKSIYNPETQAFNQTQNQNPNLQPYPLSITNTHHVVDVVGVISTFRSIRVLRLTFSTIFQK